MAGTGLPSDGAPSLLGIVSNLTLRVGFDAHFLATPYSGNGRYTAGLLGALRSQEAELGVSVFAYGPPGTAVPVDGVLRPGRARRLLIDLPRLAARDSVDLIHSQYLSPPFLRRPRCVAIHDAAFAMEGPDRSALLEVAMRQVAASAAAVLTLSEASKRDLQICYPKLTTEIHVVPCGVSLAVPTEEDKDACDSIMAACDQPVLLFIGRFARRKRIPLLIRAFDQFRRRHRGTLLLVGPAGDDNESVRLASGRSDVKLLGPVSEGLKAGLIGSADAVAFLSSYEGFGLPVVEAMLAGTPVVIARTPALLEVARGKAIETGDAPEEIAEALEMACFHRPSNLVADARAIAATYTWENAARLTAEIYRTVA